MKNNSIFHLIRNIYFFLFMAVGTVLLLIGLYLFGQYILKSYFLPKYHLGFDERRCNYLDNQPISIPRMEGNPPADPATLKKDAEKRKAECLAKLEEERVIRKTTDLYNSLSLIVLGSLLLGSHLYLTLRLKN